MVLDLLRHAEALPAGEGGDELRRLSPQGRRDLERLAARLAAAGWRPDRAFTSPLLRARESAAIVLARAAPGFAAEVMDALRPDRDPAAVLEALAAQDVAAGHALLVGHQPLLGNLVASLCGGAAPGFAPASLVRLRFDGPPEMGRAILVESPSSPTYS